MTHQSTFRKLSLVLTLMAATAGCQAGPAAVTGSYAAPVRAAAQANQVGISASRFGKAAFVPGEVIVKFRRTDNFGATLARFGLKHKSVVPGVGALVTQTSDDVLATVKKLQADPGVAYAEPNYIAHVVDNQTAAPVNDPDFGKQYAPQITQAPAGWALAANDQPTVIGIVDTGIDASHPDLKDKVLPGYDAIDKDNDPRDGNGHGTHCAGIAAASTNNAIGMAGIAPNARIVAVRVLDDNGSGSYADVAAGIVKAADLGVRVISMSLGGPEGSKELEEAVKYAQNKDVLVVAAMGNDGGSVRSYPATIPGVMAVGSTDKQDRRSSFSNFGSWISVSAPGSGIWSTLPTYDTELSNQFGKGYGFLDGTSMATPAVSGLVALVRGHFPALKAAEVKARIERTADDKGAKGFDPQFGHGRINVLRALST